MPRKLYLSLALTSSSMIAFQIVLMQILSITQWHHFAFMIISLALLGFGAAGTILSILKNWFISNKSVLIPSSMIAAGLFISISIPLSQIDFIRFDTFLLFADNAHILKLVLTYLLFIIPFFCGGLAIGLIFVAYAGNIGRLYFCDLFGSGIGGMGILILLWIFLPTISPMIVALLPITGGIVAMNRGKRIVPIFIAIISILFIGYHLFVPVELENSQYKSISKTLDLPDAEVEIERNSPFGFIQVVKSESIRHAPGLSLNYRGEIPVRKAVFSNGTWLGPIISMQQSDSNFVLDYTTNELAYKLSDKERVLILDSGTGADIIHSLHHNFPIIDAVEPNTALNALMRSELTNETDSIYFNKKVNVYDISSRTFLQSTRNKYDLIKLPGIGAFGGTSGTQAIKEEYLLTVESFALMYEHLQQNGFISVTSWMDYPYRNPLRLLSTIVEALQESGVTVFTQHIIAIKSWGNITYLVKKSALDPEEVESVRNFCDEMNFDPVILPNVTKEERSRYNQLQDEKFFNYIDKILSPQRNTFVAEYSFRINPPTDNKPYFSQFLRWNNITEVKEFFGTRSIPFFELGYLIVILTLFQILLISIILIILPLFKIGWTGRNKLWTILYFSGLGIGYMFIEIVLIQKFVLYFGSPIYSASAVISFMLISSGLGSYVTSFIKNRKNTTFISIGIIIILLLIYSAFLENILSSTIQFHTVIKAIIALGTIGLPAFVMGFPFPLGIKQLAVHNQRQIPWAWGINGCFSVISTALATVISVEFGFIIVFILAALAYGITLSSNLLAKIS